MEVTKIIHEIDLWEYFKQTEEDIKLVKKELELKKPEIKELDLEKPELKKCQYPKFHKNRYQCGDCIDLLTCKCNEAEDFKRVYNNVKLLEDLDHNKFIQFYSHKKKIEKLTIFLNTLHINTFKRKILILFARVKNNYLIPCFKKIKKLKILKIK